MASTKKHFALIVNGKVWATRSTTRGIDYTHAAVLDYTGGEQIMTMVEGFHSSHELAHKAGHALISAQKRAYGSAGYDATVRVLPVVQTEKRLEKGDLVG